MNLEEIIENYENLRASYKHHIKNDFNKDGLLEYQNRFTDLKADLRSIHAEIARKYALHDDKSATAMKYRITVAISEGKIKNEDGSLRYPLCSINQAEKYAAGSDVYNDFIKKRAFWKESLINITNLRDDINSYLIEIATKLK